MPGSVAAGAPIVIPPAAKKSRDFLSEHPESAIDASNRVILSMPFMVFVVLVFLANDRGLPATAVGALSIQG